MKIKLDISLIEVKEHFIINDDIGSEIMIRIADVKADYDVKINKKDKIFKLSIYIFKKSGNYLYSDLEYATDNDEYSIYEEFISMNISAIRISQILCEIEDELLNLCYDKKEKLILEIDV